MNNTYDLITYNLGRLSRYVRDKNKNCFDHIFTFYNKTYENISKGYNNEIDIKPNTYIHEDKLNEPLIRHKEPL